jgi:hypothetical protein
VTKELPHNWIGDWENSNDADWGDCLSQRFLHRNSFRTEAAYHRSLGFFQHVQKDILDFHQTDEIYEILPPLMSAVFLPKIQAEMDLIGHAILPARSPLPILRAFDMYAKIGWLLEVEQLLLSAKMSYFMQSAAYGKNTWGSVSGDDFANCLEDAYDEYNSWSLSPGQQNNYHLGRIAATVRLDTLSAFML